ncbi:DnaJ domain [Macleaya cordata]|uniref:DnaJ domain n=1 Tax=Macleaya cordata TaxID=56857 RepID=A0A200QHI5_MACCD|nr:DnaJ domain [Macleaya cordata]
MEICVNLRRLVKLGSAQIKPSNLQRTFADANLRLLKLILARKMATPFFAGLAVAAAALAGRYGVQAWQSFKARPPTARMRKFYEGGFQPTMTKREAALILGLRESATPDKVKEAHRKVMVANHPDAGGSHYLASKINEAKDVMLGKTKGSGSAF